MLIQADARHIPLADGCVQCCVTSPPYFGLRDYGITAQIGLEPSPDEYVAALVNVFREVRRVLKDDGTVWLNLGDSYTSMLRSGRGESPGVGATQALPPVRNAAVKWGKGGGTNFWWRVPAFGGELKPKDLLGIPWRVAFALQADGWYLRSDVIWSKPNPMPESVMDRPTKAHEYLFLLAKSERYYYDNAAIAEPCSDAMFAQVEQGYDGQATQNYEAAGVQNPSSVKARIIGNARKRADQFGGTKYNGKNEQSGDRRKVGFNERWDTSEGVKHSDGSVYTGKFTRNRRTVWTIPTMPYAGAHFATMPEALVEPCILAGSRFGDLILDPFSGSGTVLAVAQRLGRRAVGTDLNPAYHALAKRRTAQRGLMFAEVSPVAVGTPPGQGDA